MRRPPCHPSPRRAARFGPFVRSAAAAALLLAAAAVSAQNVLTVYGGVRGGGDFSDQNDNTLSLSSGGTAAVSIDWGLADGRQGQLLYSFQRSALPGSAFGSAGDVKVNVSYLHLGGRAFFDGSPSTAGAYAAGGVGITYLSPGLDGLTAELRPSMNLGVGYQWALSRQLFLRTELRGYLTLINSGGGFFCSGGCVVSIHGDTMAQFEGMVGLTAAF